MISFALVFILQGKKSMITTRGEVGKLASEIALPFIVGAGTITQSILIGERFKHVNGVLAIFLVMVCNFFIVATLMSIRHYMNQKYVANFDKNAEILLRINGFIVGAYGVDLILVAIQNITSR